MGAWAKYIERIQQYGAKNCCILGPDGFVWSCSKGFYPRHPPDSENETNAILDFFSGDPSEWSHKRGSILWMNGESHVVTSFDILKTDPLIKMAASTSALFVQSPKFVLIACGCGEEVKTFSENVLQTAVYLNSEEWQSDASDSQAPSSSATWQHSLSEYLIKDSVGHVWQALVCSNTGGELWASTSAKASDPTLKFETYEAEVETESGAQSLLVDEKNLLLSFMQSKGGQRSAAGLRIGGDKFQLVRAFEDDETSCFTAYGKRGKIGLGIALTQRTIVVVTFNEELGHLGSPCYGALQKYVKYLVSQRF
jgi:hypothetical protein